MKNQKEEYKKIINIIKTMPNSIGIVYDILKDEEGDYQLHMVAEFMSEALIRRVLRECTRRQLCFYIMGEVQEYYVKLIIYKR